MADENDVDIKFGADVEGSRKARKSPKRRSRPSKSVSTN
jgi:hypothetical protein